MTRLGWAILLLIVAAVAGFAAMLSIGGPAKSDAAPVAIAARRADRLLGVPVAGVRRGALVDTWGQARGEGRSHHGTDIPAAQGTPVIAAAAGVVEKLFESQRGGLALYVRSPARRWTYYYAHLARYAAGLREGEVIRRGDPLGYVGDTGDAGAGNFHLHFGLVRTNPDQRWWEGRDVNAYPYLANR